jgi:hypothetical protein
MVSGDFGPMAAAINLNTDALESDSLAGSAWLGRKTLILNFATESSKAGADATGEHLRNRAGEAVLVLAMTSGWASLCFEMQVRIQWTVSKRE